MVCISSLPDCPAGIQSKYMREWLIYAAAGACQKDILSKSSVSTQTLFYTYLRAAAHSSKYKRRPL